MITISTFNIQNDINSYNNKKTDIILSYLKENKIDILGLQEVYKPLDKDLSNKLVNYTITGKYRYLLNLIFYKVNEKTPIITRYPVISTHTYHLPSLFSLNRIVTKTVVKIDEKMVSIYNTHIDFMYDILKQKQLKKILDIITNDSNPIILMGDFNLKNNNPIFNKFVNELDNLNIRHLDILEKTFKKSKYHRAIDHIFVSKEIKLVSKKLVTDIPISDHYPIIIKVRF
ncbi:MAG: endonuclease/exonuclease/phosphatase family protein [Bacilli bacterium]|nr:endonuclease/exonuclease/phosphatase family protein [Bacilli bacterium]